MPLLTHHLPPKASQPPTIKICLGGWLKHYLSSTNRLFDAKYLRELKPKTFVPRFFEHGVTMEEALDALDWYMPYIKSAGIPRLVYYTSQIGNQMYSWEDVKVIHEYLLICPRQKRVNPTILTTFPERFIRIGMQERWAYEEEAKAIHAKLHWTYESPLRYLT